MEIYTSQLSGDEFKIEKVVNDYMVSLISLDGRKKIICDLSMLDLFYDVKGVECQNSKSA